ncbi:CoA-binding protein [Candidatus Woesearchaeota archaeon]|nr:CoA-binding protein [Candidatus Woesearchaeota archaeon]
MKAKKQDLEKLFSPSSIAVIGASRDPKSVGYGVLKSLVRGCVLSSEYCKSFPGKVYPVNPKADYVLGIKCYSQIKDVPGEVDLAVISVPAKVVPLVLKDCGKKKIPFAIIISAGFAEVGGEGEKLQNEVLKIAEKYGMRLVGPNCLGIIRPNKNLNASFAPTMPPEGPVGFISQSGALADSIIDWAVAERYGLSAVISYGNKADLDVHDFIEFLAADPQTKAIALYVEGLKDGNRFIEVCKKVSKTKPIIVLKAGRTSAGEKAISSHTGSLAGSYEIYKAAFRQAGVIQADTVEELFDLAKALAYQPPCRENAVAIVTNGGGCGVLCADSCEELGVNVVELKESTLKKLDKSGKMHPAYSRRNPLDIIGDALPERYEVAVNTLLDEDYIHGLIVIQTLQTMTDPKEDALRVIQAQKKFPGKPILCTYMGGLYSKQGGRLLEENDIPDFNDLKKAARAMKVLIERGRLLKKK